MLAGLVANSAACLACRLAGCLAFSASAFLQGLLERTGIQRFNMLHGMGLLFLFDRGQKKLTTAL